MSMLIKIINYRQTTKNRMGGHSMKLAEGIKILILIFFNHFQ